AVMRAIAREPDLALVQRAPVAEAAGGGWLTRPMVPLWMMALLLVAAGALLAWSLTRAPAPAPSTRLAKSPAAPATAPKHAAPCVTPRAVTPNTAAPVYVYRFVLRAPSARRVALVGDFNGWKAQQTLLRDDNGDGTWSVTLRLSPGRYRYKFLVDGQRWVVDPDAPASASDGFGGRNAVITL
ncbi:MAG: isoamylase early set domain-containing protein, partial [Myxococcales bacterium]|nr:isoamylase early set domain-containing protein [Myxococcales bacterium]